MELFNGGVDARLDEDFIDQIYRFCIVVVQVVPKIQELALTSMVNTFKDKIGHNMD